MLRIVIAFLCIFFITGKIYNDSAVLIIFMSDSELNGSVCMSGLPPGNIFTEETNCGGGRPSYCRTRYSHKEWLESFDP